MKVVIRLRCGPNHVMLHTIANATAFHSTDDAIHLSREDEWWSVSWRWAEINGVEITEVNE